MALLDWLHKSESGAAATAIPAIPAIRTPFGGAKVAEIAEIAVARPQNEKVSPTLADLYATFAERAAIREFDGGQERPEAECAALGETLRIFEREGVEGQVVCGACSHFIPDAAGCNGIGACEIKGEGVGGRLPLYPGARRFCRDWEQSR